ncbi:MAG: hypothetical protein QGH60_13165 [Phycisphaerae bacterium]|jgi:hypothetical protein|nr:hypothetical protein [Phycisphaerae bacterium]
MIRVCSILLGAFVAVMWVAQLESDEKRPATTYVADIRFGIVEPPIVAQRDITVRAATSNQQPEEKPFECSGMVWLDGRLILTSDRHEHALFTCAVDLDKMTIDRPSPHVIIGNEQELLKDAESITVRHRRNSKPVLYVMCSLSNDRDAMARPKRSHMLRCTIDQLDPLSLGRPVVVDAGPIRSTVSKHFKNIKVEPYRTYYPDFVGPDKNTYRWGNVEGIALTPDGSTLLCGMRNPLLGESAMVFALGGVDVAFDTADAGRAELLDLFTLDLSGRGISDLCWDPVTRGYLIVAGKSNGPKLDKDQPFPPNTLDCALFWWSGRKSERPICFARVPDMKIEAICRLGTTRFIAICSDEGDVSEGRTARQSVLTILDFRGIMNGRGGR